jgi:hypothetical protein
VKLLLVGHGRVGKTSLSKALRGASYNAQEPETPGIERHPLVLMGGKSAITAHIWDFGGQEFLHQTHQFFFFGAEYLLGGAGRAGPITDAGGGILAATHPHLRQGIDGGNCVEQDQRASFHFG